MTTAAVLRARRRELSRQMRNAGGQEVIDAALDLLGRGERFIAYELIQHHRRAPSLMTEKLLVTLAATLHSWDSVDMFAMYLSGPAWLNGRIGARTIEKWTRSKDRWWRRAALASTILLSRAGRVDEVIPICERLAGDRDDMVVKALSWALREASKKDARAAKRFIDTHDVAARVRREVTSKLTTGLKNPRR